MKTAAKRKAPALVLLFVLLLAALISGCVQIGDRKPIATVLFSNGGEARIRLYPDKAPNTVNNFISLANSGFYDGSPVHRIVEYVLIQAGTPADSDETDAGYYIKGEFRENGYMKNDLTFAAGIVGMARLAGGDGEDEALFDTASSQFFIMLEPKEPMDGYYAAFGKVITGMDVITAISKMDVDELDRPRDEIYIQSVRVDCFDHRAAEPETLPREDPIQG